MNKITLFIVFALLALLALTSCATAQIVVSPPAHPSIKSAQLLRALARKLYPDASDRKIVKKLFPKVQLKKKIVSKKLVKDLIQSLSDSADCSRYCAGSTGSNKISCLQHCQRYNL